MTIMSEDQSANMIMNSTDNTAFLVTTIALIGGILTFYYYYIYDPQPSSEENQEEEPAAIEPRDFTLEELRHFDGTDGKPICISVKHVVYDVTPGKNFYGPGGLYSMLAGREGSRALAKMSLEESDVRDEWDDLSDLNPSEEESLNDWIMKFQTRYTEVGKLVKAHESDA